MKYAFVALIAIYLFTYGCIQEDKEEHKSESHDVSQTSAEHAAQPAEKAVADHAEQAPEPQAHVEEAPAAPAAPAHAEEAKASEDKKESNQYETAAKTAETTVQALIGGGEEKGETEKQAAPAVAEEKTEKIEKEAKQVAAVLPCTKDQVKGDKTATAHPCVTPCPAAQAQASETKPTNVELKAAMENMVKATNDMVLMTRQMVLATQQLLEATQDDATEKAAEPEKQ